ncbi:MAG TPA: Holliday junction branch migration protein RuvA [Dissulfurispiraceae bacterium]|nr:Holliday junction branch migration protein RuvA [Dissulfurispiraceae bacterium]
MIASLRGKLLSKKPDGLILEVSGVGYGVLVPLTILSSLPEEGREIFLYTYTHVREDVLQLYGFLSEDEKRIFLTLIGITGIGPRIALNILSAIRPEQFHSAVQTEDVDLLCRVPGLGKKTAHRIILELREKLPALQEKRDALYDDALSALINLGYKKNVAQAALEKSYAKGQGGIEDLLRESLKYLTVEK